MVYSMKRKNILTDGKRCISRRVIILLIIIMPFSVTIVFGFYTENVLAGDINHATATSSITVGAEAVGSSGSPSPPNNNPPVADANGPYLEYVNQTLFFDASKSYDSDGTIVGYRWDFTNDGTYDTSWLEETITTHIYAATGNYTIKLQVIDNDEATDTDTTYASIKKLGKDEYPPVADANGPYYIRVNQNVTFNGSGSHDPDGTITSYVWDFGDNGTGVGVNPIYAYAAAGTYTVILMVVDNDGLTHTAKTTINVMSENRIITINDGKQHLIDTTGDGEMDTFYGEIYGETTLLGNNRSDGCYLIDVEGDGTWDYIYDPMQGSLTPYVQDIEDKQHKKELLQMSTLIAMIIAVTIIVIYYKKNVSK